MCVQSRDVSPVMLDSQLAAVASSRDTAQRILQHQQPESTRHDDDDDDVSDDANVASDE